ncbi:hypothetical protein BABINDRAFT_159194 [Babjeviella inositovora NRRL Y-12698]|uniref:Probable electron transfer flavoprotein subunit alpha n=1 Tax=Babjeviella inositovora NRRL Y-12698 TaxID=984486 RepID=A0A1E3QYB9_9ASCO|nr:uncharacterized protein BABINDRAFT_159194 [Babjeviella inositovora NRRL Y-12698]ODQ82653.1 hypothetical protein BABINDRAFT_159194 [Babjeviella inositovora NRRL Y-12698]
MLRSIHLSRRALSVRFSSTLAFIEASGATITPSTLSALTAAQQLGKPITAVVTGSQAAAVTEEVKKIASVSKILVAADAKYDHYFPEELSPLIQQILTNADFTHFVVAASTVGKNLLPRVGALLDFQPISDIVKVEAPDTFVRPIYAGNALATVKTSDKIVLASVRGSSFAPVELTATNETPVEEVTAVASECRTSFVSEELVTSERPDLASAVKVVSGGRGLQSKEQFDAIMEPLAKSLNAAIGASRAAVDAGFCDNSLQVGQTGKVVAPELYIAVGISGAIQHLAGMKDAKTIVAINKDEESPIFTVADIGLVGDLFEVVPELTQKIEASK